MTRQTFIGGMRGNRDNDGRIIAKIDSAAGIRASE